MLAANSVLIQGLDPQSGEKRVTFLLCADGALADVGRS